MPKLVIAISHSSNGHDSFVAAEAVILDELRFMVSDSRGDPGGYVPSKAEDPAPAPLQGLAEAWEVDG